MKVVNLIGEIAAASQEQSQGIEQVSKAVEQCDPAKRGRRRGVGLGDGDVPDGRETAELTLTLHNRIRSTHSSRLQMAGLVDMKGMQAKSTWDEFRQMNQTG